MAKKSSITLVLFSILCFSLFSCGNSGSGYSNEKAIQITDTCITSPEHTYAVYIPHIQQKCKRLPLIVILDPHGKGKTALKNFKEAADKFPAVFVASNLIRNNFPRYLEELNNLVSDASNKYPVTEQVYLAGFSGGSRMALNYAMHAEINGLLLCGALGSAEQIKASGCPVYAIIGMDDFNFIEVAQFIFNPAAAPSNLSIQFIDDSHQWPEDSQLKNALSFIRFQQEESFGCNSGFKLRDFSDVQQKKFNELMEVQEIIKAGLLARNMNKLYKNADDNPFTDMVKDHDFATYFQADLEQLKESIRFELSVRSAYYNALQEESEEWWKNELNSLEARIESDKDHYRSMAYRRIKAFLGIMCYSLSNQYVQQNNFDDMDRLLGIYKMLEPNNPDRYFFSAILAQHAGKETLAQENLKLARENGFTDERKIKELFPN